MLRSKAPGISIFGNGRSHITIIRGQRAGQGIPKSSGLSLVGWPPKISHFGRRGVGWHVVLCYGGPEWFRTILAPGSDNQLLRLLHLPLFWPRKQFHPRMASQRGKPPPIVRPERINSEPCPSHP